MTHAEEIEAQTAYELDCTREAIALLVTAIRAGASHWSADYRRALREEYRFRVLGHATNPLNPAFKAKEPLAWN